MSNQQVDDYIKQSRQAGISDSEIKQKLLESGWGNDVVSQAFMNPVSNPNVAVKPQKDYWHSAYKNFLHFSYFGYFLFLVFLIRWIVKFEPIPKSLSVTLLLILAISTVWFAISQLFKKHHKKAVLAGYVFLSAIAISLLWQGSLLALLLIFYLFYLVYRASKMPVAQI
ncbi:hypothetical protein A2924_00470 [Candidatus Giovannonibacteria bacterium RIFCSPLOWO2_01_FULL_44_16]|uniref:DUF5671 domain-containing protein n=1 Tax=Candidatus Giovannonibacteria bacterium RIFCSPLOWO2_01_FULL_44_16 TaxID=1798348 RepID=A0A1F5X2L6_9BACT|nr:MAG: hypothetical protein A2924_00470 [Candidatus Giovannonibacteria bacterium RIFCSPLOWO2_01_FULL_44_16]